MKQTINYVLLFSLLVFLKFNDSKDSKDNDPSKLGSYLVIAYLIYQLFKGKNVEGWPANDVDNPSLPTCGPNILYIGSPSPYPGPEDNIRRFIGDQHFGSDSSQIYIGPTCRSCGRAGRRGACSGTPKRDRIAATGGVHPISWVSQNIDRENIKTIAVVKEQNSTAKGTFEGMIFCSSSPNDTCVPSQTGDDIPPLYQHCMAGVDNLINTNDLLDCFADGGSRCGHENCALYHSLHLGHIVTDIVHSSPNDHCSHVLYQGGSPNPTMDNGSVIQQIVLKYANHYDKSINTPEEFETAVMGNAILSGAGNSNVFIDSTEDQKLCAKFNALYDSDCLRGSPNDNHSQLFENIHTACSNISYPINFNLQDDWLNNMDRYCSIPDQSADQNYDGIPMDELRNAPHTGFLYVDSDGIINDGTLNISPLQTCSSGYQGDYRLVCNNNIKRVASPLEISNNCSPSPASSASPGPSVNPCSPNRCAPTTICRAALPGEGSVSYRCEPGPDTLCEDIIGNSFTCMKQAGCQWDRASSQCKKQDNTLFTVLGVGILIFIGICIVLAIISEMKGRAEEARIRDAPRREAVQRVTGSHALYGSGVEYGVVDQIMSHVNQARLRE